MDIVNTAYWAGEFIKVLIGYVLVEFVWPRFVFARYLRGRPARYQFAFCVTVQTVLLNTAVLGLGLLHLLNQWTVRILFYGVPLVVLYLRLGMTGERADGFVRAVQVARIKQLLKQLLHALSDRIRRTLRTMGKNWLEYLLLGAVVVYALVYFSWGAFDLHSYGFGDQYVHHSWIYGLMQGQIFSGGVYPEAMHCLIYTINTALGVRVYSLMLFGGCMHGVVILLSIYCLGRELFGSRYTPILVLAVFVLLMVEGETVRTSMARFQWALPLEFGLAPQFLCVAHLIRYLREDRAPREKGRFAGRIFGPDLFLFTMALAAAIASHFYPVIIAFFMCLGVAVLYFRRVFSKERFLPLVASVLCAVMLAVAPMAGALASGMEFQKSMDWAMSVIEGTDTESRVESEEITELKLRLSEHPSLTEGADLVVTAVGRVMHRALAEMSSEEESRYLQVLLPAAFFACLLIKWIAGFKGISMAGWSKKRGANEYWLDGYRLLPLMALPLLVVYAAPYFGLPELVSGVRMGSSIWVTLISAAVIPLDAVLILLGGWRKGVAVRPALALFFGAVCAWVCTGEHYHGYLYYELTRYPSEVAVMTQVIDGYEQDTYTVVSPTDGLYQVIEYGRHEELLDFVRNVEEERYFLPTEHVFVFVEKKPIDYAQEYSLYGPAWLGTDRREEGTPGQPSEIASAEISRAAAEQAVPDLYPDFENYKDLESRTIIESKAYYWCQRFMELYPREMSVYYEDADFVCYYIKQEANAPFDLTIAGEED